jgi:hypothetical protein
MFLAKVPDGLQTQLVWAQELEFIYAFSYFLKNVPENESIQFPHQGP